MSMSASVYVTDAGGARRQFTVVETGLELEARESAATFQRVWEDACLAAKSPAP